MLATATNAIYYIMLCQRQRSTIPAVLAAPWQPSSIWTLAERLAARSRSRTKTEALH